MLCPFYIEKMCQYIAHNILNFLLVANMKITKGDIWGYLQVQTIANVARPLYKELGEECWTKESLFKSKN